MFHAQIFLNFSRRKLNDLLLPKRQKIWGVSDFVLKRTCPEKYPKSEKSGLSSLVYVNLKILQLDL